MKVYATIDGDIKVTKEQFDEIMKKQYEGYTVHQALLIMGLTTVEKIVEGLDSETNRKYAQYDTDKKIEEIKEFAKTLNMEVTKEEDEKMDLKVKYTIGRSTRTKIISGANKKDKYISGYDTEVITNSGTIPKEQWLKAVEEKITANKEQYIIEGLIKYALEECAWINTEENAKSYAIDMYANETWKSKKWVGYETFRKKLGIEMEVKKEEEVEDMEFTNIESVVVKNKTVRVGARCTIKNDEDVYVTGEVLELRQYKNKVTALTWDGEINVEGLYKIDKDITTKEPVVKAVALEIKEENNMELAKEEKKDMIQVISMDDLVKKDLLKVSNAIYNSKYTIKNNDAKILIRIEGNIATVYDDNTNVNIVKFEVNKKKKYSVVSEIETLYSVNINEVALEVIDYVKRYGKITKVKVEPKDIAFIVEGHNEDKYIELVEVLHMTHNTHVNKNKLLKEIMNNHVNITEKYEQSEVECGDFVNFIKNKNGVGTYQGAVERVNTLAGTVDVKYKSTSGEIDLYTIPFENLVRIKTVTIKEKIKQMEEPIKKQDTIDKKEVTKLVDDVMEISKICETNESNYSCIKSALSNVVIQNYNRGCSIYGILKDEKYIEKITEEDINDDIRSIENCSEVIIEIIRDKRFNKLTVRGFVEIHYIDSNGIKKKTDVIIKEIVEKLPKKAKQIDENVIKLNKENT